MAEKNNDEAAAQPAQEEVRNAVAMSVAAANNNSTEQTENPVELEKIEEEKLKSKYPAGLRAPGGHSAFLQKRLQKGQKYFDSGDYQMAKQKPGAGLRNVFLNKIATGEAIPTPESVPARKTSIIQPCNKFTPNTS